MSGFGRARLHADQLPDEKVTDRMPHGWQEAVPTRHLNVLKRVLDTFAFHQAPNLLYYFSRSANRESGILSGVGHEKLPRRDTGKDFTNGSDGAQSR
jgi:hypothetical protein